MERAAKEVGLKMVGAGQSAAAKLSVAELERLLGLPLWTVGTARIAQDAPLLHYVGDRLGPLPDRSFDHFASDQGTDARK